MIEHIVWDWNGTLIDDVAACVRSLNGMLRSHGMGRVTVSEYRSVFGFPVRKYYERLGFDFARQDWDAVATDFHRFYRVYSRKARLRRGARRALETLRRAGVQMSVLSASELSILERMVNERGIRRYFAGLYGLSDVYASSKLEAGRALIRGLGVKPSRLLLVGDTEHDCEVASDLRCACVLLPGGHQSDERLRRCGCDLLPGIGDVAAYVTARARRGRPRRP